MLLETCISPLYLTPSRWWSRLLEPETRWSPTPRSPTLPHLQAKGRSIQVRVHIGLQGFTLLSPSSSLNPAPPMVDSFRIECALGPKLMLLKDCIPTDSMWEQYAAAPTLAGAGCSSSPATCTRCPPSPETRPWCSSSPATCPRRSPSPWTWPGRFSSPATCPRCSPSPGM